jgi:hypothetical protein
LAIRKGKDALAAARPEVETFGLTAPPLPAEPSEGATRDELEAAITAQAAVVAVRKDVVREFGAQVRKANAFCVEGLNEWLTRRGMGKVEYPSTGGAEITPTVPELPVGEFSHYTDSGLRARFVAVAEEATKWGEGVRAGAILYEEKGRVTQPQLNGFCDVMGYARPVVRGQYSVSLSTDLLATETLNVKQRGEIQGALEEAAGRILGAYGEVHFGPQDVTVWFRGDKTI